MQIMISDRGSHAGALAQFFSSNVTPEYISYGELQGYRALDPSRWSPDLESHLRVQIGARLGGRAPPSLASVVDTKTAGSVRRSKRLTGPKSGFGQTLRSSSRQQLPSSPAPRA